MKQKTHSYKKIQNKKLFEKWFLLFQVFQKKWKLVWTILDQLMSFKK